MKDHIIVGFGRWGKVIFVTHKKRILKYFDKTYVLKEKKLEKVN